MALGDHLRSRLALRIYLIGLAQIAVVAVGFIAYAKLTRPDYAAREAKEDAVAATIVTLVDDEAALQRELERVRDEIDATITVSDPEGRVLASTTPADAPPCLRPRPLPSPGATEGAARDERSGGTERRRYRRHSEEPADIQRPRFRGPSCRIAFLRFPGGDYGRVEFRPTKPPRPPSPFGPPVIVFVLVVVGISSILLARSIARPLQRLSKAAHALGEGDLEARSRVDRRDELGDVARSFDEMAVRIRDLLSAERELVANVSHELRTPLARIRVALDIAAEGDAAVARESLVDIADDLDELERLVDDILTAARLDMGAPAASSRGIPPLRLERLDSQELLDRSIARFRSAQPERSLKLEIAPALPEVEGDPVLLRRVFDNLLDNAHKYSDDPQAAIELTARDDDGALAVEVIDHGIGVGPADLERVFEPFFRADRSRTRATGGHGLGLALARRIVEAHHGTIALDSKPGEGTRVTVRLPPRGSPRAAPAQ